MSGHAPFFFAEPAVLAAAHLTIEGEDARHLAVVRRASPGDLVRISDGRGTIADARLTSVTPAAVGAEVLERTVTPAPSPRVEVHQGLAKGGKVDGVIRHLVEVGDDRPGGRQAVPPGLAARGLGTPPRGRERSRNRRPGVGPGGTSGCLLPP